MLAFVEVLGSRFQGLTKGFERRDCQNAGKKTPMYPYHVLYLLISRVTARVIDQVKANSPTTMFEH